MRKLLIGAGALLLATAATSAFAQPYYGGYGGYGYGGPGSYRAYVQQMRACQRHDRLHRELDAEHAQEHAEGLYGPGDHRDLHDTLEEAHEAYHEDHPNADFCNGIGYRGGYAGSPYRYRYGYAPNYGYGNSFSFGFGYGR